MTASQEFGVRWLPSSEVIENAPASDATALKQWKTIAALGSLALLRSPILGFFCSVRCPGNVILQTYDLARALRDAGVPVISGFHTPMEKECLDLLLRGTQSLVVCPARSIENMRLSASIKEALAADRLLFLSPFGRKHGRVTATLADERNKLVAALAAEVFVAYATEGGKTEELCRHLVSTGKPVFTFHAPKNARLIEMGCCPMTTSGVIEHCRARHFKAAEPQTTA
jgi:predicted Rossmann fold nucleotide-binding protein DprA/Smf involved in DNA uptake